MVTFSPHYIIVNLMSVPLLYRQSQAKLGVIKDPYANNDSGRNRGRGGDRGRRGGDRGRRGEGERLMISQYHTLS
jgi:hypothetical protein